MHYLVLNHWSKFQTKLTIYIFGGVRQRQKTTLKQPKNSEYLEQK